MAEIFSNCVYVCQDVCDRFCYLLFLKQNYYNLKAFESMLYNKVIKILLNDSISPSADIFLCKISSFRVKNMMK